MLTVKQILRYTPKQPKHRFERRKEKVKIQLKSAVINIDKGIQLFKFKSWTDLNQYNTLIACFNDLKLTRRRLLNTKVMVSCSCPRFINHSEYALYLKGSSVWYFTKGHLPGEGKTGLKVNPRLLPYVCKHVAVGFQEIPFIEPREGRIPKTILSPLSTAKQKIRRNIGKKPKVRKVRKRR